MTQLNTKQLEAVTHRDGPMLVLAGPGSGKTAVLVNRLKYLVDSGVDPGGILVLTFSRAAAQEMEKRYCRVAENAGGGITFGTFHSIFYHILKSQGLYRSARILTRDKKIEYMKHTAVMKGIKKRDDPSFIVRLTELVSLKKMGYKGLSDKAEEDELEALALVFDEYNRMVRSEGCIDFDDMITDCLKMLKENDKIRQKWHERYPYILVDEFQDIDIRQYEVLKLLAGSAGNIFCVGDDDQSIYSFRGADPGVMKRFSNDNRGVKHVKLKINYRCPQKVIDHARMLIGHNRERFDKDQISINVDMDGLIEHRCFANGSEEAAFCGEMIESLINENKITGAEDTIGILYRISRSGDTLEEVLKRKGIPYMRKDKSADFYDNDWVKDIMAYLKLSLTDEREDMMRILNRPHRGLSRECIGDDTDVRRHMLSYYRDSEYLEKVKKLHDDIDFIRGMTCYGAVNYILRGIGLLDHFRKEYKSYDPDRNWDEITDAILERARMHKSVREWLGFIEKSERGPDYHINRDPELSGSVELRTIHSAKGLEYDNVFLIGLQEGVFPLKKYNDAEALEEERRLFYVGMTRSRKRLWLTGIQRDEYGKRESRFIKEAGL